MLNFPEKIKVGFQYRDDTYTNKLSFITYQKFQDGKIKHGMSWENWRDQEIAVEDYDNIPTPGFVFNGYVGGGERELKIRMFDIRGFEAEIKVSDFLLALEQYGCEKGGVLGGKFVYGWEKNTLRLLSELSENYKNKKTEIKFVKIRTKDLEEGCVYLLKQYDEVSNVIYLGRFDNIIGKEKPKKHHVFVKDEDEYIFLTSLSQLKHKYNYPLDDNFPEILDQYLHSKYNCKIINMKLIDVAEKDNTGKVYFQTDNQFYSAYFYYANRDAYWVYQLLGTIDSSGGLQTKSVKSHIKTNNLKFFNKIEVTYESGIKEIFNG